MRAVLGVLVMLSALVVVLAKKRMGVLSVTPVRMQSPIPVADQTVTLSATAAGAMVQIKSQQFQRQIRQTVETTLQQARPVPDEL